MNPDRLPPSRAGSNATQTRMPLLWATLLVASGAALLAAALAYALIEGLGLAAAWGAGLAAALGLVAGSLPLVALVVKFAPVASVSEPGVEGLDPATGAVSKALFQGLAERECARARRYSSGAALLLVDVDRYAHLCQAHGVAAGDAVLHELARLTVPSLRGADALARFGPSQLAVFVAQADATGALDVAERIRERAEQLELPFHPQRLRVTVSVGVVQLRAAHMSLHAMKDDGDEALLAARQAGGNCVRAAPMDSTRLPTPGLPKNNQRLRP